MEAKSFFMAMGLGAAAGTAVGMMLPRNREMQRLGRQAAQSATRKVNEAADALERKLT
ncbi:MAG: hypothetical protein UEU47_05870 [Oscillospiraceae bacterium]|nr:hypothetical protein [Oscillospiraceae bacterium]